LEVFTRAHGSMMRLGPAPWTTLGAWAHREIVTS
jgi:hypothetical protein